MTTKPWESSRIDLQLAKQLISSQFPQVDCSSLTLLGDGWDNISFCTHDDVVFRFPRREFSVTLLLNEINLLPFIQNKISLPIPLPLYVGSPTDEYPWPFAGYKLLSGQTSDRLSLTRNDRKAYVRTIATFLAELHHIDTADMQTRGAPLDLIGRVDIQVRLPKIQEYLDKIDELELFNTETLRQYALNFKLNKPVEFNCFVHGDLYSRHLLIDSQKNISGIIDWGDIHIGNAAVDLALAHSFLPPESLSEFKDIYGVIDDETWRLSKFRAIYNSVRDVVYGHDIKDNKLVEEGLKGLGFINETLI
ncbi:MAG: phosphotransferase [Candidatus Aquirickettsiella sp.]